MSKKLRIFSVQEFEKMLEFAPNVKEISAVIVVAMGQVSQKQLNQYAFAGLLSKASEKIYSFK